MSVDGVEQLGVFRQLDPQASKALLGAATRREYPSGAALFHQGDSPTNLFQLCSGTVRLTQITHSGAQTTIRLMAPGDLVGCVAFLQQFPFPATATAIENASALIWTVSQFAELKNRYPAIAAGILTAVGDRAKEMVQRVVDLTSKDAEQRLASLLLHLCDRFGRTMADGTDIRSPTLRHDLAEMSGVTYHTVTRVLSQWERRGLVRSGRERISVLQTEALATIAEIGSGKPSLASR